MGGRRGDCPYKYMEIAKAPSGIIAALEMKNRLRVLRAEREWSQAELAERLGVSRQTVNAVETGKYAPSLPLTFKIARLFGKRVEEISEPDEESRGI